MSALLSHKNDGIKNKKDRIRMKKLHYIFISTLIILGFTQCDDDWNKHYGNLPETSDQSVWDALKSNNDAQKFVALMEEFNLDSIFESNDVYTLFVPGNDAMSKYENSDTLNRETLEYHILRYYLQPTFKSGKRKIQTMLLKFAEFENDAGVYSYDGIPISFTSPLYQNGRFFIIDDIATPNPSLYEHIAQTNKALKRYIDDLDSIVLDLELSKPIDFDENGNTIYDSVINIINKFEMEYFEISEESRVQTATIVFPEQKLYDQALTTMAQDLGFTDYNDIPYDWQENILLPYLIDRGVFHNLRDPEEFLTDSLENILNDNVEIIFRTGEKVMCSNGYFYNYQEFEIDDSLYMYPTRNEGERFLLNLGTNRFVWNDSLVTVDSDDNIIPKGVSASLITSNDSMLQVDFPKSYEGKYNITFRTEPVFPRRYLVLVRTHMDYGGIYDIYVNDQKVHTFNYDDYVTYRGVIQSNVAGKRFIYQGRFNKFDFWVDNVDQYGRVDIRFEYKGPGEKVKNNGLVIDYIDLVPEEMTHLITRNP